MSKRVIHEVTLSEAVDFIAETTISATHDLGSATIHLGSHAQYGSVTIVSEMGGRNAVIRDVQ